MQTPTTGALRLARAGLVAVVTVALASLAHVLAGGALPPLPVVGALAAVALAAAVLLTRSRVRPTGAVVLLGAGQLAVHSSFRLVAPMACMTGPTTTGAHVHGAAAVLPSAAECSAVGAAHPMVLGASAMLVLHVVATVVAALLIAGVDRAIWWLAVWLRPLVAGPAVAVVVPRPALPTATETPWSLHAWWRDAAPRRGPPVGLTPVAFPR